MASSDSTAYQPLEQPIVYTNIPIQADSEESSYPTEGKPSSSCYPSYFASSQRRKNVYRCLWCFTITLIPIFFILFFLLPRVPNVTYQSTQFNISKMSLVQTWSFENRNFYGLAWSNIVIDQWACPDQYCSGSGQYIGTGTYDDLFITDGHQTISLDIDFVLTQEGIKYLSELCISQLDFWLLEEGNVDLSRGTNRFWIDTNGPVRCTV